MNTMHCYTIQPESRKNRISGSSSVKLTEYTVLTWDIHLIPSRSMYLHHIIKHPCLSVWWNAPLKRQTWFFIHLILDDFSIFQSMYSILKYYWKPSCYKKHPASAETLKHLNTDIISPAKLLTGFLTRRGTFSNLGRCLEHLVFQVCSIPNLWHKL